MELQVAGQVRATLLIVDDDARLRGLLARIFRKDGYTVVTARRGLQALALAEEHEPQIVLLDTSRPEQGGLAVLEELRQRGYRGQAVILTGHASSQGARAALAQGAFDYVSKPFRIGLLRQILRSSLTEDRGGDQPCEL